MDFNITSQYRPTGDQPEAIRQLVEGVNNQDPFQTLLGVTGSGKTFTVANVIQQTQKPTLVLSHNKTLAAQLYGEFKQFFPEENMLFLVFEDDLIKNRKVTFDRIQDFLGVKRAALNLEIRSNKAAAPKNKKPRMTWMNVPALRNAVSPLLFCPRVSASSTVQARAWTEAGFAVDKFDQTQRWVEFVPDQQS